MPNRSQDWFHQALRDLDQADDSCRAGRHEWACFATHQSEKDANQAIQIAEEIIGFVQGEIEKHV